jgi:hypothetical protein
LPKAFSQLSEYFCVAPIRTIVTAEEPPECDGCFARDDGPRSRVSNYRASRASSITVLVNRELRMRFAKH